MINRTKFLLELSRHDSFSELSFHRTLTDDCRYVCDFIDADSFHSYSNF